MLDFISKENERHRAYFDQLFQKSTSVLKLICAIAGGLAVVLGISTVQGAKATAAEAAGMAVKDRIELMKPSIDREIKVQVEDQFKDKRIEAVVRRAADEATANIADPIIREEVRRQIEVSISRQQSTIDSSLRRASEQAVERVRGDIDKRTDVAVTKIVTARIDPQLQELSARGDELSAASLARGDDALALDHLQALATNLKNSDTLRKQATTDYASIRSARIYAFPAPSCDYRGEPIEKLRERMGSLNPSEVDGALGCLPEPYEFAIKHPWPSPGSNARPFGPKGEITPEALAEVRSRLFPLLPLLLDLANNSPSIKVRLHAYNKFVNFSNPAVQVDLRLRPLDRPALTAWWNEHKQDLQPR